MSPLFVPLTHHRLLCCVVLFGLYQHPSWTESSDRECTHLTGASDPPQGALRGAARARFPNETSDAALRDPANKHFAQRFFISVTEEVNLGPALEPEFMPGLIHAPAMLYVSELRELKSRP